MRPSPASFPGRIRTLALLLAAGVAGSCDSPTEPSRVRRLAVTVPSTALRPGDQIQVSAIPLDASGSVVDGALVKWRSLTPATLDVAEDGLLLALAPGFGIARATAGPVHADVRLDLVNPPISRLTLNADTLRLTTPGAPQALLARAFDAVGVGIIAPALTWESSAERIATVGPSGSVTPVAVGRATVSVQGDGLVAATEIIVAAQPSATSPVIASVAPATVAPGQSVVVSGTGFGASPNANTVLIDGTPVTVTAASPTQLTLTLPGSVAFPCVAAGPVSLQVGTPGGIGVAPVTLTVAPTRTLAVGQSLVFTSATVARCNELAPAAGRYLITVPNAARALGSGTAALTVRGSAIFGGAQLMDAEAIEARNAAAARAASAPRTRDATSWLRGRRQAARARAHARLLEANAELLTRRPRTTPQLRADAPGARLAAPPLGAILPLRIPNVDQPTTFCSNYASVGARVVHVGARVVLLEDTSSVANGRPTVAGQMDPDYAAIGEELESVGWPLVRQFGDPLVMDSQLDDNGHVMIVFTPRMNAMLGGAVLATVVNCDFFPRALLPSSNVGEYVYAQVPTTLADGMAPGSRARWRHEMRATLVHELKHVTSYAERFVRGYPVEERWLEEATARLAEELYARAIHGFSRYANAGFSASLACEVRADDPSYPACAETPRVLLPHLADLWSFLDAPTARSPLGPTQQGDLSYYGSGWSLARWLSDQEVVNETAFFTALTESRQFGIANLEARTGRPWDEILPEWSLALVADDLAGVATESSRIRFPAFDLRSAYQGLCDAIGSCITPTDAPFTRAWPVRPVTVESGSFALHFGAIEPGGFAVIELVVSPATARQVIELRGVGGAALPPGARLAILRIQ
jgi:IPT/TIG domain